MIKIRVPSEVSVTVVRLPTSTNVDSFTLEVRRPNKETVPVNDGNVRILITKIRFQKTVMDKTDRKSVASIGVFDYPNNHPIAYTVTSDSDLQRYLATTAAEIYALETNIYACHSCQFMQIYFSSTVKQILTILV